MNTYTVYYKSLKAKSTDWESIAYVTADKIDFANSPNPVRSFITMDKWVYDLPMNSYMFKYSPEREAIMSSKNVQPQQEYLAENQR